MAVIGTLIPRKSEMLFGVTAIDVGPPLQAVLLTLKGTGLLANPATVACTTPVAALLGTIVVIWLLVQLETFAVNPLIVRVLLPCDVPKLVP